MPRDTSYEHSRKRRRGLMCPVSTFFGKDALLRRQARFNRTHKNGTKSLPAKIRAFSTGSIVDIILEEDPDYCLLLPRAPPATSMPLLSPTSPLKTPTTPTTRARRRHSRALNLKVMSPTKMKMNLMASPTLEDISEEIVVTFTNVDFSFPLPPSIPLPLSPHSQSPQCKTPPPLPPVVTSSSSSSSSSSSAPSSPDSQNTGFPLTPSSSNEELPLSSHPVNLRRATAIKPLVINKIKRPTTLPIIDRSGEKLQSELDMDMDVNADEEDEEAEWYAREFERILTLNSSNSRSFPAAHRDSLSIAPTCDYPLSPFSPKQRRRRRSSGSRHSVILSPRSLYHHPSTTRQLLLSPRCGKTMPITSPRRPPPRMSIPDDACSVFSVSLYADDVLDSEPSPSSIYSQGSTRTGAQIRQSFIEVEDEEDEEGEEDEVVFPGDFEVQVDCQMMFPLSIPGTPIDLEADIARALGLDESWLKNDVVADGKGENGAGQGLGIGFTLEDVNRVVVDEVEQTGQDEIEPVPKAVTPTIVISPAPAPPAPAATAPLSVHPYASPSIPLPPIPTTISGVPIIRPPRPPRHSTISLTSTVSFPPFTQELAVPSSQHQTSEHDEDFDERRHGLKSKWSSSTLGSLRDEHAAASATAASAVATSATATSATSSPSSKFPGASKLKMYFQGQHKRSTSAVSPLSETATAPPTSPKFSTGPSPTAKLKRLEKKEKDGKKGADGQRCSEGGAKHGILVIGFNGDSGTSQALTSPRKSCDRPSSLAPGLAQPIPPSPRRLYGRPRTASPSRTSPSQFSVGGGRDSPVGNDMSAGAAHESAGIKRIPIPFEMF